MNSVWTKHLKDKADKDALEQTIRNSNVCIDAITRVVEGKKKEPKLKDYDSPSWPYLRADLDGYNRALNELLLILDIGKTEK